MEKGISHGGGPPPPPPPSPSPSLPFPYQGHDGPKEMLGKAEQFFLAIASVPRYTIRTKCMLTAANFPERAHELKTKVEDVAEAVKEVREGQRKTAKHCRRIHST